MTIQKAIRKVNDNVKKKHPEIVRLLCMFTITDNGIYVVPTLGYDKWGATTAFCFDIDTEKQTVTDYEVKLLNVWTPME